MTDTPTLQQQIDSIDWYHEFDFGGGLRAVRRDPYIAMHRAVWAFVKQQLDAIVFDGKTVLDIGCWDGFWSFYAERRGARSVLATDDLSQSGSDGRGLLLAKKLLNSSIEINQHLSVYDLASLSRQFDIVLCVGVYYHLVDPFAAFAQIRHCCHEDSIAAFEGDATLGLRPDTFCFRPPDGIEPVFVPTPHSLKQLLHCAYFDVVEQHWNESPRPPSLVRRLQYYSAALGLQDPAKLPLPAKGARLFTLCRPLNGPNPMYIYAPPFGLHRYDPRFCRR